METAGYSGTPLVKKLGYKTGFRVLLVQEPGHYSELLAGLPEGVEWNGKAPFDLVHLFTRARADLEDQLPRLKDEIKKDGTIWVSWPKKSSGVISDMNEDLVRDTALALGLVDVKVCAVDQTWSGLKLVWRKENRQSV